MGNYGIHAFLTKKAKEQKCPFVAMLESVLRYFVSTATVADDKATFALLVPVLELNNRIERVLVDRFIKKKYFIYKAFLKLWAKGITSHYENFTGGRRCKCCSSA